MIEDADRLLQLGTVLIQLLSGFAQIMNQSGIVGGNLIHLFQGLGQLAQTNALFTGSGRDFTHQTRYFRDRRQNFLHGLARMRCMIRPFGTECLGLSDQLLDFIGRLGCLLGQRTHGRRDHRKTFTGFSSPC